MKTASADPYWTSRWVNPFEISASRDEGVRMEEISEVKGAVAPVVTKHSFEFAVQFHVVMISVHLTQTRVD